VNARLRVTEQGEVIDAKYGLRGIAFRSLERMAGAVLLATAAPPPADPRESSWRLMMADLTAASRAAYRALVHEHPAFYQFFRDATPIDVIERMAIGSRPPSRRSGRGIENLRAIPWVFAWTQSRHMLPGWYGLGTGLEAVAGRHGEAATGQMVREWPFLATLVEDVEMVLAKADFGIGARYAALSAEAGPVIFPLVQDEFDRTVRLVLALRGTQSLLESDPTLRRSIQLRNPYVDPMSFMQIELLRTWREGGRKDPRLFAALLETVNGIAQGLQNTG
jgi:phosphoenolpyruvate carboxylase